MLGALALLLSYVAIPHLPLTIAAVIGYLSPVFTAILAGIFLKERIHPLQWGLFAFTFLGVVVLKGVAAGAAAWPLAVGLLAVFCSAFGYVTIRRSRQGEHPVTIVLYTSLLGIPISALAALAGWQPVVYTHADWLCLLLLGVITQLAQLLMTRAYQLEQATKVAPLNYTGVLYALLFDYLLFGQGVSWRMGLGTAMVLLGVYLNASFQSLARRFSGRLFSGNKQRP